MITKNKLASNTAPVFTLEQITYLERMFPEQYSKQLSDVDRCYIAGQRSVLAQIRTVSGVEYVPARTTV